MPYNDVEFQISSQIWWSCNIRAKPKGVEGRVLETAASEQQGLIDKYLMWVNIIIYVKQCGVCLYGVAVNILYILPGEFIVDVDVSKIILSRLGWKTEHRREGKF